MKYENLNLNCSKKRGLFYLKFLNANVKSETVCPIDYNVFGINEGGMINGVLSRKVEITLNSAVSLVKMVQPLLFIPCYKSGGAFRGLIWLSEVYAERVISKNLSQFPAPLDYNLLICETKPNYDYININ